MRGGANLLSVPYATHLDWGLTSRAYYMWGVVMRCLITRERRHYVTKVVEIWDQTCVFQDRVIDRGDYESGMLRMSLGMASRLEKQE